MRVCTICRHPDVEAINGVLAGDMSYRTAAVLFDLSKDAMCRHYRNNHVPENTAPITTLPPLPCDEGQSRYIACAVPKHFNRLVEFVGNRRGRCFYSSLEKYIPAITLTQFKALQRFGEEHSLWTTDYDGILLRDWFSDHVWSVQCNYFGERLADAKDANTARSFTKPLTRHAPTFPTNSALYENATASGFSGT